MAKSNKMQPLNAFEIHRMHSVFCDIASSEVRMDLHGYIESLWFQWLRSGFTESDLRMVVASIRRGQKNGKRNPGALKFQHLIENTVNFGDELSEAKSDQRAHDAQKRKPMMDAGKAAVLRATGRETEKETEAKPASAVIGKTPEEMAAFFKRCREEHGI